MKKNSNKNNDINFTDATYGRGMNSNPFGTMSERGVQSHSSGVEGGYYYMEMQKLEEETVANEKKAKIKKILVKIGLFALLVAVSVFVVLMMQPMELFWSIAVGVESFCLLVGAIVVIVALST